MEGLSNDYQIRVQQPVQQREFTGNPYVSMPEEIEDGDNKLKNALIALGATAAAGVVLYKTGALGKAKEALTKAGKKAGQELAEQGSTKAARKAAAPDSAIAKQIQNLSQESVQSKVSQATQNIQKTAQELSQSKKTAQELGEQLQASERFLDNLIGGEGSKSGIDSAKKAVEKLKEEYAQAQNVVAQGSKKLETQQGLITNLRTYGKGGQEIIDLNRLNKNRVKRGLSELTLEQFQKLQSK